MARSPLFNHLYSTKPNFNIVKQYFNKMRIVTDSREAVLRYANYLEYKAQIKASPNGLPKNFGASIPDEIIALRDDPNRMAFKLQNDLLGAYDEISPLGRELRASAVPFWSWKETNFRRYWRLFKNSYDNATVTTAVGRKLIATAAKTPYIAYRVGKTVIKFEFLKAMLQAANSQIVSPTAENGIPDSVKKQAHLTFGTDKYGRAYYFPRVLAFTDIEAFFGLDFSPNEIKEILSGRKTIKDIANNMLKSVVNEAFQSLGPHIKVPIEMLTRRKFYPDVFNPSTVRDRGLELARNIGLEHEYTAIMGLPSKPYASTLKGIVVYENDPLQSGYHEAFELRNDFRATYNKTAEGFLITPRGSALFNLRMAHRFGDKAAEEKYLKDYLGLWALESQVTGRPIEEVKKAAEKGIEQSFANMNPLAGMNKYERNAFLKSLGPKDRLTMARAVKFYNDVLIGNSPVDINIILGNLEQIK